MKLIDEIFILLITLIVAGNVFTQTKTFTPNNAIDICPLPIMTPEKVSIDNDDEAPYVDETRAIKDLGTDIVVNEFFNSKETLFNFMKLVYETINSSINNYREEKNLEERAMFFTFKGGNVLRMVANTVFDMLPEKAGELLKEKYSQYFKRSDADFSVFIDENYLGELDYETVLDDVAKIIYQDLNKIREEINNHKAKYFDFFGLSKDKGSAKLKEYLTIINNSDILKDPNNKQWFNASFFQLQLLNDYLADADLTCDYQGQFDYKYKFDEEKKVVGTPLTGSSNWIVNSDNRALEWPGSSKDDLVKFNLLRAKVYFEYTYKNSVGDVERKPIGGELIDVSIPHRDDFRTKDFLNGYDKFIANYTLINNDTNEALNMKAESLTGLVEDLSSVIFEQFERPWEGGKYSKRVNRLLFLSMLDMINSFGLGSDDLKDYLANIELLTSNLSLDYNNIDSDDVYEDPIYESEFNLSNIKNNYPTMKILNEFFDKTLHFMDVIKNDPKEKDSEYFNNFVKLIKENLNVMKSLAYMDEHKGERIDISKIYKVKLESLF